jgi:hypothetical protein
MNRPAIASSAGALAALYWDLAEEMRGAAVTLSVAVGPDSALPVVDVTRLAEAIHAGMILQHLAERSAE